MCNNIIENDIKEILDSKIDFNVLKNKSMLVTGATGMIGAYIVKFFEYLNEKRNYDIKIFALARNEQKLNNMFSNSVIKIKSDICTKIDINENIDYIFNCASPAGPNDFKNIPVEVIDAIVIGTKNIYDLAIKANTKKVILVSSIQAYGELEEEIEEITEDMYGKISTFDISSCYAQSKKLTEVMAVAYEREYNIKTNLIRLTHAYGPYMNLYDGRMLADFVRDGVEKTDIVLKSDGLAYRNLIYISDVISAFLYILIKGDSGAYNITNKDCVISIRQLAKTITELFDNNQKLIFENLSDKNVDTGFSKIKLKKLDATKLEKLGWEARIDVKEGMKRTISSFWK